MSPAHIFFYGTLMRGFPLRRRAGIEAWLRFVGAGAVPGVLFDLGPYPAALESEGTVRGEIYHMLAPLPLLARVDRLEGYAADAPWAGEYRRRQVRATLDDGGAVDVWIYFYNRPVGSGGFLPGGDYRRHAAG